jgi:hypothetical protein
MALTKQQLLDLNSTLLASNKPITAENHRDFNIQFIEAIFVAVAGMNAKGITLSGTTYQDDDLIGKELKDFLILGNGTELTQQGATFDSITGTITFPFSLPNTTAKLWILPS